MKTKILGLLAYGLLAGPSIASAGVITFNDGTNGAVVGNFYAGQGVTFTGAKFDNFGCQGSCGPNSGLAIQGNNYQPTAAIPIEITFSSSMSFASIYGINVGANGVRMDAFDAVSGGNLLGFAQDTSVVSGVGATNNPFLQVSAMGIRRLVLYQIFQKESEGMLFDTLTFTPQVPEPGTLALLGLGLAGLGLSRRRKAN